MMRRVAPASRRPASFDERLSSTRTSLVEEHIRIMSDHVTTGLNSNPTCGMPFRNFAATA